MNNKINNPREKITKTLDLIILLGSLIAIITVIGYTRPLIIAPIDNFVTTNNSVLFAFDKANIIYLDDNINFTSPERIYAKDNLLINLKPGKYYWKIEGVGQSEIRELTIKSSIDLRLREVNETYEIVNSGNSKLNVEIYDKGSLVGNVVLDVDKSMNASGTEFIGGSNESA